MHITPGDMQTQQSSTYQSPIPDTVSPFFKLPREIRDLIYTLLIMEPARRDGTDVAVSPIVLHPALLMPSPTDLPALSVIQKLFTLNRQICLEARETFFLVRKLSICVSNPMFWVAAQPSAAYVIAVAWYLNREDTTRFRRAKIQVKAAKDMKLTADTLTSLKKTMQLPLAYPKEGRIWEMDVYLDVATWSWRIATPASHKLKADLVISQFQTLVSQMVKLAKTEHILIRVHCWVGVANQSPPYPCTTNDMNRALNAQEKMLHLFEDDQEIMSIIANKTQKPCIKPDSFDITLDPRGRNA